MFTANQFTATKWESAEQKAKFANHFVRFVKGGFKPSLFYSWFYRRLSMTFGHIAHYNRQGFWHTWCQDSGAQAEFLLRTAEYCRPGDPEYTYSDVEKVLGAWVRSEYRNLV